MRVVESVHRQLHQLVLSLIALALVVPTVWAENPPPSPNALQSLYNLCKLATATGAIAQMPDDCLTVLKQNAQFTLRDAQRLLVVESFLKNHPNPQLLRLLLSNPTPSDTVKPMPDGSWSITVPLANNCPPSMVSPAAAVAPCTPQLSETVATLPFSGKLAGIYNSVVFVSDGKAQLNLYTNSYDNLVATCGRQITGSSLSAVVVNCDLSDLPAPSTLGNASIAAIGTALDSILARLPGLLVNHIPPVVPPSTADCDNEIGGTPQYLTYGDRTYNSASCTPSPTGLYATLSDTDFPARAYLTCVKAQGEVRSTCHSFASISAVEMMISELLGVKVNLSEEDLMEHFRFVWDPNYVDETGDAYDEMNYAVSNNYAFALESSWDYNPSYKRGFQNAVYVNSCLEYPTTEAGCSDSAPQAPGYCVSIPFIFGIYLPICELHEANVPKSSYRATSLYRFWKADDTEFSKEYMILAVVFNNGVAFGFNTTDNFRKGGNSGYVVYDANDVQTNDGNHWVHVVGAVTNSQLPTGAPPAVGGGYLIVKNSWNNCFGDAGYLYLNWDYVKAVGTDGYAVSTISTQ